MSVQFENSSIQYDGNNSASNGYPVPFPFFLDSELGISVTDAGTGTETKLLLDTGYTVTGAGNTTGGCVFTTFPVPAASKVTISRGILATQPLQYRRKDASGATYPFPAAAHEQGLDRLTFLTQQNARRASSAFRLDEAEGGLEGFEKRGSAFAGINAGGKAEMYTAPMLQALLNLSQTFLPQPAVAFSNAGDRNEKTPAFLGQVGGQLDTEKIYIGTSIVKGGWTLYEFSLASDVVGSTQVADGAITMAKIASSLGLSGKNVTLPSACVTDTNLPASLDLSGKTLALPPAAVTANLPSGFVLNTVYAENAAFQTIHSTSAVSDTAPTSSTGEQILTASIKPSNTGNKVNISLSVSYAGVTGNSCVFVISRASTVVAAFLDTNISASYPTTATFHVQDAPNSTDVQVYSVKCCCTSAGMTINGNATARLLGGSERATLTLQEIKA